MKMFFGSIPLVALMEVLSAISINTPVDPAQQLKHRVSIKLSLVKTPKKTSWHSRKALVCLDHAATSGEEKLSQFQQSIPGMRQEQS